MSAYKKDLGKMYTYLRGRLDAPGFEYSQQALAFTRKTYKKFGLKRDGGEDYFIHPLSMACDAIAMKGVTDEMIAVILYHDLCEDCYVPLDALPGNETIRRGVKYMTIRRFEDEEKYETKKRYYHELNESREAVAGKGFDIIDNLTSMEGVFDEARIKKFIIEKHELYMPVLKEAKYEYPELQDLFHTLRTNIGNLLKLMARYHNVELS